MSYRGSFTPALVIRHTGQVIPLGQAPVTLGRQAGNTVVLADSEVSRHHTTLYWQAGTYIIQDQGSVNGTYVNERRITAPQALRHGDTIRVGSTLFDVQLAPAADQTTEAPAYSPASATPRRSALPVVLGGLAAGAALVGLVLVVLLVLPTLRGDDPVVTIQWPADGAQVAAGTEIILKATATGARDITRLELSVDGLLVATATSPDPDGQASLFANQPWTFGQAGPHVVSAVAYTAKGRTNSPVSVSLTVADAVTEAPPITTPPPATATAAGDSPILADLVASQIKIELETGGACNFSSTQLGVRVSIENIGQADAGAFAVDVNGVQQDVIPGLAAGQMTSLWFPGYASGENTVIVDAAAQVQESDENNNTVSQMVPIPTLPPTCTPPPPDAPTPTPTPSHSPTPTSTHTPTHTPTPTPTATPTPTPTPTPTQRPPDYDLYVRRMDFSPNLIVGETIELYVMIATDISPPGGPLFPASHFRWRQGPSFPWQEEVCPEDTHYASCVKTVYLTYSAAGDYNVEVEADNRGEVPETDEGNNTSAWTITINPGSLTVTFDTFPDGTPIGSNLLLNGDEFLAHGIRLAGAPASAAGCGGIATVPAILHSQYWVPGNLLTTADPANPLRCNFGPVTIHFTTSVRQVTLTFTGATDTYTMEAYDSGGGYLGAASRDAVAYGSPVEVSFTSPAGNIARITLTGPTGALTAITQIRYEW